MFAGNWTSCAIRTAGRLRSSRFPCPAAIEYDGQRLPATYVNFYFVNGAMLVPTLSQSPTRSPGAGDTCGSICRVAEVIGIDCVELIWGLGAIHCLSQQQPG